MNILCFDPGKACGFIRVDGGQLVDAGTVAHTELLHLLDFENRRKVDLVLVERISPRPNFGWDAAFTCEQVGVIVGAFPFTTRVLSPTRPAVNAMLTGTTKASKGQTAAAAQACQLVGVRPKKSATDRPVFWTDPHVSAKVSAHVWDAVALYAAYHTATPADRDGWEWRWWE